MVAMTCHRRMTDEEIATAEASTKRPVSSRTTQFSHASTARSLPSPRQSDPATPRTTVVQIQSSTNPEPVGSAQRRTVAVGLEKFDSAMTTHCTSQCLSACSAVACLMIIVLLF